MLPIVAFTALVAALAVHLAGRRDVGESTLPDRTTSEPHVRLLSGPIGLAVRTLRPAVVGWWVAIAVIGLLFGLLAKAAGATISGSSVQEVFRRLGAPGAGTKAFLGVAFLIVAVLVGFTAAGQMTAARGEESEGRLDHLLVGPLSRSSWLGGRLFVSVIVVAASGIIGGAFIWIGAATQHSGVDFASVVGAGLNVVPASLCVLGIGALVFGLRPRIASPVTYGLLGWSLLVELVGGIGALSHWVLDTSIFHQMASAPAVPVNWEANAVMAGIGATFTLAGGLGLGPAGGMTTDRRDPPGPAIGDGSVAFEDLTARARIHEAALAHFATEGYERDHQADSPRRRMCSGRGSGSKDKLRVACDEYAFEALRRLNTQLLADPATPPPPARPPGASDATWAGPWPTGPRPRDRSSTRW